MSVDVESVRKALRAGGFGPDRALVRTEGDAVTVTLREDVADAVCAVLAAPGVRATVAGSRVVRVVREVDEPP